MKWISLLNLRNNADYQGTVTTISEGVSLRGYNLWLLLCSSVLACIGLDTNSAAIIIGAMLISPLMSPILGVGLSIAIQDKKLLLRSSRNLAVAVLISLLTSITYFFITPFGLPTEELQARTFPTLLDVLVAFFGGIAGIVSISRTGPTTAIPGVAIATALMPPLCTSGFGIATGNWNFFGGAFYLFVINAVFISMATYLIVKYLHFPERKQQDRKLQRLYSFWFTSLSIVAVLPSIYFLYTLYQREIIREKIDNIVLSKVKEQGNEILKWEVEQKDSLMLIKVYHSGAQLSDSMRNLMDSGLAAAGMHHYKVNTRRINLTREEVTNLSAEVARQMFADMHIKEITRETPKDSLDMIQVAKEVKAIFPVIDTMKNGWMIIPKDQQSNDTLPVLIYHSSVPLQRRQSLQLSGFLKVKFKKDSVILTPVTRL